MTKRRYLVIGSGGREHALAWKLSKDGQAVWVAPGNDGIAEDDAIEGCVNIAFDDVLGLTAFVKANAIDVVVVGPEQPLCDGLIDALSAHGVTAFGPTRAAAQLEGSKTFCKRIMQEAGVPTAEFGSFESLEDALEYVRELPHPLVIKADGLAAGKGVVISQSLSESESTLHSFMVEGRFGQASARVIIEECLKGPEMSFMVITDGETILPLASSRDHKRLKDNDEGPNTGGMGAIVPSPQDSPELTASVIQTVFRPLLRTLATHGIVYQGFLYAGLMLTERGPYVLEFNVRLGDPETQAILLAMKSSLAEVLEAALSGDLATCVAPESECACVVVFAAQGYPDAPKKGAVIEGFSRVTDAKVFHAGTRLEMGQFVVSGGRVLGVAASGISPSEARQKAYHASEKITFEGLQHRTDIGVF